MNEQCSRNEYARKTAQQPAKVQPAVLPGFWKDLELKGKNFAENKLDKMVSDYMDDKTEGNGNAAMKYASQLLSELADTLKEGFQLHTPLKCVMTARCAYSVAEYIEGWMFYQPGHRLTQSCVQALFNIDKLLDEMNLVREGKLSKPRVDKWYVYLNVLEESMEPEILKACVDIICGFDDELENAVLKELQKRLDDAACRMIERCNQTSSSDEQDALLRRAALAVVYSQQKFDNGRPKWKISFSNKLVKELKKLEERENQSVYEPFVDCVNGLINSVLSGRSR